MKIQIIRNFFLFWMILLMLTGCAGNGSTGSEINENKNGTNTSDEKVAVALWENSNSVLKDQSRLIGDTHYFLNMKWDEENKRTFNTSIYRKLRGAKEEELITELEDAEIIIYFVDETESIYYLYAKEMKDKIVYSFSKINVEGIVIYDTPITYQGDARDYIIERLSTVFVGEADRNGNVCLTNRFGDLYLFDGEGKLVNTGLGAWDGDSFNKSSFNEANCGLVNAGAEGVFTYCIEDRKVSLQKVDVSNGKLETALEVQMSNQSSASLEIFNGYEMGVFISDSDELWKYNVTTQNKVKMFGWGDSSINLKDYTISAIGILPDDSLYALAHKNYDNTAFVHIDYKEKAQVQEKQVVTLSSLEGVNYQYINSELANLVAAFNRENTDYKVEITPYASEIELNTALIRGEGPDLFDFRMGKLAIRVLAKNGVLEELSPYFEKSTIIQKENLLPSIKNAGTIDGEFVCVFPHFTVAGWQVKKGTTSNSGWTPEEYVELGLKSTDGVLMLLGDNPQFYYDGILNTAIIADMDNYINWEKKECYFDGDRFVSLLESIQKLELPKTSILDEVGIHDSDILRLYMIYDKFYNGELLVNNYACVSIGSFKYWENYENHVKDFQEIVGYPNQSGNPYFRIECSIPLGMNKASQNKEGAWAFLEFILTEDNQNREDLGGLPVRQDSFDRHVELEEMHYGLVNIDLTDEEKNHLRFMVDNAYWFNASNINELRDIILEEAGSIWTGDKTAKEAAQIIQSRIQLFINE